MNLILDGILQNCSPTFIFQKRKTQDQQHQQTKRPLCSAEDAAQHYTH